jgi:hypothetical protein
MDKDLLFFPTKLQATLESVLQFLKNRQKWLFVVA